MKKRIAIVGLSLICAATALAAVACGTGNVPEHDVHESEYFEVSATAHWKKCERGGEKFDEGEHEFVAGECSVCHYFKEAAGDFVFEKTADGFYTLLQGKNTTDSTLTVPSYHEGKAVISIGTDAFLGNTTAREVKIAPHAVSIGSNAFSGCTALESIALPERLESIGDKAFAGCSALSSVTVSDDVKYFGLSIFENTPYAANAENHKNGALYLGNHLLEAKDENLGNYTVESGTVSIASEAFFNRNTLTGITVPASVKNVGYRAFASCKSLASAEFNAKELSYGAFRDCTALERVTLPEGLKAIPTECFAACKALSDVRVPKSVTVIGANAFDGCAALSALTLPDGLKEIYVAAFAGCGMQSLTLPDGVTTIDRNAFANCLSLKSVTLPNNLDSISPEAFRGCTALESVTVKSGNGHFSVVQNCLIDKRTKTLILGFRNFVIPADGSIVKIGDYAFDGDASLTVLELPAAIKEIGAWAFSNCANLSSVTLSNGTEYIGDGAFSGCAKLTSVTLPKSVTCFGPMAFASCPALDTIDYGGTITEWKAIANSLSVLENAAHPIAVRCTDGVI